MSKTKSSTKESELVEEINNYVNMFNTICKQVGSHLLGKFPKDRNMHIYNDVITDIIKKKPSEPISIFIMQIWAKDTYKNSILESNEVFFTNGDHNELTNGDEESVAALFQFKSCWGELNDDSKLFIKEAMKTLVNICDAYIENKDELNKLRGK
jgi:hypothetical protein